jgi:hypothetical protein
VALFTFFLSPREEPEEWQASIRSDVYECDARDLAMNSFAQVKLKLRCAHWHAKPGYSEKSCRLT